MLGHAGNGATVVVEGVKPALKPIIKHSNQGIVAKAEGMIADILKHLGQVRTIRS